MTFGFLTRSFGNSVKQTIIIYILYPATEYIHIKHRYNITIDVHLFVYIFFIQNFRVNHKKESFEI